VEIVRQRRRWLKIIYIEAMRIYCGMESGFLKYFEKKKTLFLAPI